MRGRTNVGGGGGISINATVERKTIKSGDIVAGDFVEYYTEPTYITQTSNISFVFCVDDYAIATIGNTLAAFKDGNQVATFTGMICSKVVLVDNFIVVLDNTNGLIGALTISNDEFVLVNSINTTTTGFNCIGGGNGKIVAVKRVSNSEIAIGVSNISSIGELSNYQETSIAQNIGNTNCFIGYYDEKIYYIVSSGSYELIIAADNTVSIGVHVSFSFTFYESWKEVYRKESVIVIALNKGSSYAYQGTLVILDFVTGSQSSFNIPDHGEILTCINDGYFLASKKISYVGSYRPVWSNQTAIQYYANTIVLYHFDEDTYAITEVDSYTIPDDYTQLKSNIPYDTIYYDLFRDRRCAEGMVLNSIIYGQFSYQYKVLLSSSGQSVQTAEAVYSYNIELFGVYDETQLQRTIQKEYVAPYSGGHPIGVAKEGGTTNDIIDVYIPVASS